MVNKKKNHGKLKSYKDTSLSLFSIDDYPESVPAAGYRNGTSLNNTGENGNYWSATPNESNTQNAYNLNFNSSNHNTNWNNRNNGQSVRPVAELIHSTAQSSLHHFSITKEQLLKDLIIAYKDARKHKRGQNYQLQFEFNLEDRLVELRNELISGTYYPRPASCFIIHDPKMREIFAAEFRDRIVHHLFYNYTHSLFERNFITDSYSCIKNRGTHYGIHRLKHHILSVSAGYSKPCYVLKIDICGYFMHINRNTLLDMCKQTLEKMQNRQSNVNGKSWKMLLDFGFINYLLESMINSNPLDNCKIIGKLNDWNGIPKDKSLFYSDDGCGLPIGNLSSQLFSNIYLNVFDQFVKRKLGCKHYGRYVDDAYIVSDNRDYLKSIIPTINSFLQSQLDLSINYKKTTIIDAYHGIEFLGAFIKPFRTYISNSSLNRIKPKVKMLAKNDASYIQAATNSFLGVLSHYDSYCLRRILLGNDRKLIRYGYFSSDWLLYRIPRCVSTARRNTRVLLSYQAFVPTGQKKLEVTNYKKQ
ncbi:MAG: reverse transcriptase domain-containing protein [Bacteroidales bacterium]|nr:reverse transcriptase domain-containing protein [Bacteroidales bacterium]MDD3152705.1 reverse transcriptase domain-containing protein [Bacteroidales bacterium]MDD3914109.1 reverse transcriptase domain-containing protein [Bacteroidales bacterium]MDD4634061.1 reverse transcriptase domain-containing protein [Bacteroidales bacterium]